MSTHIRSQEDNGIGMESTALVVPIGHAIGMRHDAAPAGSTHVNQLRVGPQIVELGDLEFGVWALAHGVAEQLRADQPPAQQQPWTRQALTEAAVEQAQGDRAEIERAVASLYERQLLDEVNPDGRDAQRFAERYRLIPLVLGLGPREEDGLCGVGLLYHPLVLLAPALADLWQWSPMSPHLWGACQESAAVAKAANVDDPKQTEPGQVLHGVLGSLHVLLASGVACVDLCVGTKLGGTR